MGQLRGHRALPPRQSQQRQPAGSVLTSQRVPSQHTSTSKTPESPKRSQGQQLTEMETLAALDPSHSVGKDGGIAGDGGGGDGGIGIWGGGGRGGCGGLAGGGGAVRMYAVFACTVSRRIRCGYRYR